MLSADRIALELLQMIDKAECLAPEDVDKYLRRMLLDLVHLGYVCLGDGEKKANGIAVKRRVYQLTESGMLELRRLEKSS